MLLQFTGVNSSAAWPRPVSPLHSCSYFVYSTPLKKYNEVDSPSCYWGQRLSIHYFLLHFTFLKKVSKLSKNCRYCGNTKMIPDRQMERRLMQLRREHDDVHMHGTHSLQQSRRSTAMAPGRTWMGMECAVELAWPRVHRRRQGYVQNPSLHFLWRK